MATILLQPLNPFDFKALNDWQMWKCKYEQYLHESGLESRNEQRQVSIIMYCLGEQSNAIFFNW